MKRLLKNDIPALIYKNDIYLFLKWMNNNITYGYKKQNGSFSTIIEGTDFYKNYVFQLPSEFLMSKIGVCWDQSCFQSWYFDLYKIKNKLIYIELCNINRASHTFSILYLNDGIYWFENSWKNKIGIHGPFKNEKEIEILIYKLHSEELNWKGEYIYKEFICPQNNLNCEQFMKFVISYNRDVLL